MPLTVIQFEFQIQFLLLKLQMSSPPRYGYNSPTKFQRSLSPQKQDIDFLARKVVRLQTDYNQVADQLNKVRTKLRRAEDFQIKYDLLLRQKLAVQNQLKKKQNELYQQKKNYQELKIQFSQKQREEFCSQAQKTSLLRQLEIWKNKVYQAQQKIQLIKVQQIHKAQITVKKQVEALKNVYLEKQNQMKSQIRVLKLQISEKNVIQQTVFDKTQSLRTQKDQQIERLSIIIQNLREDHLKYVQSKNDQICSIANKFQNMFNFQIQKLRHNQEFSSQKQNIQIQGLRGILELKNKQIQNILKEMGQNSKSYSNERQQLNKEIQLLKQKIYQRQRENELEIYNIKQRLISLHAADLANVNQKYQQINSTLQSHNKQLNNLNSQKQYTIQKQRVQFQTKVREMEKIISQKISEIKQLKEKLRHNGDINSNQITNLHTSFHKITTQKQNLSTQYQSTLQFLHNQIAKLTNSSELKNQQIKDLHLQMAEIKKNYLEYVKDLQNKWKLERKQRQQERDKQRNLRETLESQFRQKQQKWRQRQRILQRDKQKQQRQKIKLNITIHQLQKNIERLNRHISESDQKLGLIMQKNQSNLIQTGSIRRQLTGQLEKQRSQFQAMKKMEEDQIYRKYQIQINRLTNQNQRLQNELNELKISYQKLQDEYKKVKHTNKNIDKISKQKLIQYQKKMAALNSQINLTQNLYQSFILAKSKVIRKDQKSA